MSNTQAVPEPPETVLIVDDEEPVRRTFREWLEGARLGVRILTAADAESALRLANEQAIDLVVLDWNLGAGNDGLQLLEDLFEFNRDVVAIMITGYAHQATPLQAMRMGVRDYLDKNQDLDRNTFLSAVRKQLDRIRPARRERRLHAQLVSFREAVEKVLPLVQSAAALSDPLSPPRAVSGLLRFLMECTGASGGVLIARSYDAQRQPAELYRAYDDRGEPLTGTLVPFSRSLAGAASSSGQAHAIERLDLPNTLGVQLQEFERSRHSLLVVPLSAGSGLQVVVELFDKQTVPFTAEDRKLVEAAAGFGGEVLRGALAERQTHGILIDAIAAALGASDSLSATLEGGQEERLSQPPPPSVLEQLQQGLSKATTEGVRPEEALRLAEAVRVLSLRHGPGAVRHCIQMVEGLRRLLDEVCGAAETAP